MEITDLKKISAREGIPQAVVEKDYVLSVVLNEISKLKLRENIVFKGGTAIKKIYFHEARFSEDLDFTVLGVTKTEILKELKNGFQDKEVANVRFISLEDEGTRAGLRLSLKYVSFLDHPQRIRFDFSFRNNLVMEPIEKEVLDSYSLDKASIKVLKIEEIFAEK
ncbi:nucleotidyl transferase AbiEii/AbiGii toxin family protein, partial [Candidatus Micrarchaeota archaeon]|nr:nucleotidyl transferase AbiEii/AbiGii toxin family protein [Candidatus Micrarchaeota archaeon]